MCPAGGATTTDPNERASEPASQPACLWPIACLAMLLGSASKTPQRIAFNVAGLFAYGLCRSFLEPIRFEKRWFFLLRPTSALRHSAREVSGMLSLRVYASAGRLRNGFVTKRDPVIVAVNRYRNFLRAIDSELGQAEDSAVSSCLG